MVKYIIFMHFHQFSTLKRFQVIFLITELQHKETLWLSFPKEVYLAVSQNEHPKAFEIDQTVGCLSSSQVGTPKNPVLILDIHRNTQWKPLGTPNRFWPTASWTQGTNVHLRCWKYVAGRPIHQIPQHSMLGIFYWFGPKLQLWWWHSFASCHFSGAWCSFVSKGIHLGNQHDETHVVIIVPMKIHQTWAINIKSTCKHSQYLSKITFWRGTNKQTDIHKRRRQLLLLRPLH